MAEPQQDSLLREIDEELRQEHYAKLWQRYGKYVIAAGVLLVLGVAGYQGWRSYDLNQRRAQGERFVAAQALALSNQPRQAAEAFAEIAKSAGGGYRLLARLRQAAAFAQAGDTVRAAEAYRAIAEDGSVDPHYRDLALVLGATVELDNADPAGLAARLAAADKADNPWRHSIRELLALLAQRTGDRDRARALYAEIAADPAAPGGLRARAGEMLSALGG